MLSTIGLIGLTGCGSAAMTTAPSNKNAAGVRASYYEYFQDERTGNAQAACAQSTKSDQATIAADGKTATCEAAVFKHWHVSAQKTEEEALKKGVAEVAKYKILVVGNRATVINPELEEADELIYSGGHWLLEKTTSITAETAEGLKKEAREAEAKRKAGLEAGEAQAQEDTPAEGTATTQNSEPAGSQTFSGNGVKSLGTITVEKESTIAWTNDGPFFSILANSTEVHVTSSAHSGTSVLEAGTYHQFEISADGNWTIKIAPK
jgi:hypothetical protein